MKTDGGQPAFPCEYWEGGMVPGLIHQPGMTLRQWYAGMAMQGILASGTCLEDFGYEDFAIEAFKHADAMLSQEADE